MKKQDYHNFFKISGVEDSFIQEALSFILLGGLTPGSSRIFYDGRYKTDRRRHLSFIMLNKYIELLKKEGGPNQILKWWDPIQRINKDIKGDLHIHSSFSDGTGTLAELVRLAEYIGYKWVGFSDHSPLNENPLRINETTFKERHTRILELREKSNIIIYESLEADISKDGSLMFPDSFRDSLDFVIASIHENFIGTEDILKRIEKALDDPLVIAYTHPYFGVQDTVINTYIEELLQIIKTKERAIEINLAPQFLSNNFDLAAKCREMGVKVLFSSDSHFISSLYLMKFASLYYPEIVNINIINLQNSVKTG